MKPALSIITPVKARHTAHVRWLNEAVESVQGQTRHDWEMVIVDDHSKVTLPSYEDTRIKMYSLAGNDRGVSVARNEAARLATSDLLLPLDADDKLADIAVESFLGAWTGSGIVYSDVVMFGTDFARAYLSPDYDFDTLLRATFMLVGCLHKKEDWERVGGWRADMQGGLEDWEYWIALGELGVCGTRVPEPLYWYRRQPGGRLAALKKDPEKWHRAYNAMRELHIDTYNGRRPVGCCGGSAKRIPGVINKSRQLQAVEPVVTGTRELLIYTGNRQGGFGIRGQATGVRYTVPGRGDFLVDQEGRPGVDKRDVPVMLKFNSGRDFQKVPAPAAPKPVAKPVAKPAAKPTPAPKTSQDARAWKPAPMESAPVDDFELTEDQVADPKDLTLKELRTLTLTPWQATQMLAMEVDGKSRSTVIKLLKKATDNG